MGHAGARDPRARPGGRPRKTDMREVLNAIFYITHEGCTWRALPHDFPPWRTVYNYFDAWKRDGTWDRIIDILRVRLRAAAGRPTSPRVACIDSQSVKTAGGGQEVGTDGGKRVCGRKRHIVVDTMGLLLAVVVTAAHVDDAAAAQRLFAQMPSKEFYRLEQVQADNKYHNYDLYRWLRVHHRGYEVVVISRARGAAVRAAEEPLGGGADLRLVGAVSAVEQGLRAHAELERGGGEDRSDSSLPPPALPRPGLREPTLPVRGTSPETRRLRLLEQTLRIRLRLRLHLRLQRRSAPRKSRSCWRCQTTPALRARSSSSIRGRRPTSRPSSCHPSRSRRGSTLTPPVSRSASRVPCPTASASSSISVAILPTRRRSTLCTTRPHDPGAELVGTGDAILATQVTPPHPAPISATATSLPVRSAVVIPAVPFVAAIGNEQVLVTGAEAGYRATFGTVWTVTRGYNNTTATDHNLGDSVFLNAITNHVNQILAALSNQRKTSP